MSRDQFFFESIATFKPLSGLFFQMSGAKSFVSHVLSVPSPTSIPFHLILLLLDLMSAFSLRTRLSAASAKQPIHPLLDLFRSDCLLVFACDHLPLLPPLLHLCLYLCPSKTYLLLRHWGFPLLPRDWAALLSAVNPTLFDAVAFSLVQLLATGPLSVLVIIDLIDKLVESCLLLGVFLEPGTLLARREQERRVFHRLITLLFVADDLLKFDQGT